MTFSLQSYPLNDQSVRTRTLVVASVGDSPMTLAEAKKYLRIYHEEDDDEIPQLVNEAYGIVEARTGRMIRTYAGTLTLDRFPDSGPIVLPRPPLTAVTALSYYDTANALQTISTAQVQTAAVPGLIHLPTTLTSWPATKERLNAVTIAFTGGGSEPEQLRAAVRLLLNASYHDLEPAKAEQVNKRIDGLLHGYTLRDPRLYGISL